MNFLYLNHLGHCPLIADNAQVVFLYYCRLQDV